MHVPKTESGWLASNNAYMVLYEREDQYKQDTESCPPDWLLNIVTENNERRVKEANEIDHNEVRIKLHNIASNTFDTLMC